MCQNLKFKLTVATKTYYDNYVHMRYMSANQTYMNVHVFIFQYKLRTPINTMFSLTCIIVYKWCFAGCFNRTHCCSFLRCSSTTLARSHSDEHALMTSSLLTNFLSFISMILSNIAGSSKKCSSG